jgi:ribosomal-protein-alanine N-acetyltransferase
MRVLALDPTRTLRPMTETDLGAVMRVERAAYAFPWTEGIFRDCLRVGYSCWVAELGGEPVAHGIMSTGGGECEILNLCVHPDWRGRQLGRGLLRRLLALGRRRRADTVFLEVRPSNHAAIALYRSEGFCEIGQRRDYYPAANGKEDALIMAKPLL